MTDADLPKLSRACGMVLTLLSDYKWHTTHEIMGELGSRCDPTRRLRDLRKHGFVIECRRNSDDTMRAVYRLIGWTEQKEGVEYDRFMASDDWRVIRDRILKRDKHECVNCGRFYTLEVHHLTYERFGGDERDEDLVTLCTVCHRAVHKFGKSRRPNATRGGI